MLIFGRGEVTDIRSTIMEIEPNFGILLMPNKELRQKNKITEREAEI